jgi:hypothetical protein
MKNVFALMFVVLLASCGAITEQEVEAVDTTAVEVVAAEVEVVEVDTTVVDTTVVAQ